MTTTTDVRRFAYRQGPGKGLLGGPHGIDDSELTTSRLPPAAARGDLGSALPFGTHDLLASEQYPTGRCEVEDPLGHVLVTAFGLQRREPGNRFNDHRVTASVRSKFPVHAFVVGSRGASYLDQYRHALVDVDVPAPEEGQHPTVLLAGRWTDFPAPYGWLRGPLAELELGINLRSLHVAAELFGVPARTDLGGERSRARSTFLTSTGAGRWTTPLAVHLEAPELPAGALPPRRADDTDQDALLDVPHPSLEEAAHVTAQLADLPAQLAPPAPGLPVIHRTDPTSWARAAWNRTAGRMPAQLNGFAAVPTSLPGTVLADVAAWAATPPPHPALAEVARRVRLSVAVQRIDGYESGVHRTVPDGVVPVSSSRDVMTSIQGSFGYPTSPETDCGIRHANLVWVFSVDVDALLRDLGPASWTLLQIHCGWVAHGLSLGAAAHGLFARPARSFDEFKLAATFQLPRAETPVFMTVSGRSRFAETMLDLRT